VRGYYAVFAHLIPLHRASDPSPVPLRLVKAPVAGHPLPKGEGKDPIRCHSEFREVQIGWTPKTGGVPQAQGADYTFSEQPRKPSRRFWVFA
jgi:hypothetical protein